MSSKNMASKKIWRGIRLTDALIIAGTPVFVYFLKFIYDLGYGSHFGIPPELISFSFQGVFVSVLSLSVLLFILYGTIGQALASWIIDQGEEKGIGPLLHNTLLIVAIMMCIWIVSLNTSAGSIAYIFLVYLVLFLVRHFVWPIVAQRRIKGYKNKIKEHIKAVFAWHRDLSDLFAFPLDLILFRKTFVAILATGILAIVFSLGLANAQRQSEFFVLADSPQWVVARFVDDRVVLIEVESGRQTGRMQYRDLQGDNIILEEIELGRVQGRE